MRNNKTPATSRCKICAHFPGRAKHGRKLGRAITPEQIGRVFFFRVAAARQARNIALVRTRTSFLSRNLWPLIVKNSSIDPWPLLNLSQSSDNSIFFYRLILLNSPFAILHQRSKVALSLTHDKSLTIRAQPTVHDYIHNDRIMDIADCEV